MTILPTSNTKQDDSLGLECPREVEAAGGQPGAEKADALQGLILQWNFTRKAAGATLQRGMMFSGSYCCIPDSNKELVFDTF